MGENKYQEALDRIKTAPGFMGGTKEYRYSTQSSTPFLEDIAVLQELVDKETPMKVRRGNGMILCCKCNKSLYYCYGDNYCSNCGQKIDWSNENE